ncbi:MAG: hypothetical protein JXB15_09895 [Anaerolineales bacterium]|nr:hypothetical protein [Anaerolineales bacterium]
MRYRLRIPARINILGNPTDANEGDFATISAAIDLYAEAVIEDAHQVICENGAEQFQIDRLEIPAAYTGEQDLLKGAVNRLYHYSDEFRSKLSQSGFHISVHSNVPRQSGLGGSSLIILLTLAGLRELYHLDRYVLNDYVLSELAQRVEAKELGITCGFADRYVPLFGGIAYLDYRGKLHQADMDQEPYVTYERLDAWAPELPLVAIMTGIQHDSGDVHGRMRPRYVEEYDAWRRNGGTAPALVQLMQKAGETAWRGKIALLSGDLPTFGHLMTLNHRLVDEMMCLCGFQDGAGWANNLCIQTAMQNGALGAKLTGAGGGGSVFALVRPGEQEQLMEAWQRTAAQNNLHQALIFRPRVSRQGLEIQPILEK